MKIYLLGFMGAGKSTVGKKLAVRMNFRFLDTDNLIEKRENMSIPEIFKEKGEDYFREIEHEILRIVTGYNENLIVSTGGGAPCYRDNMALLNTSGITVYLKADHSVLYNRLTQSHRKNRPLIRDKSPEELMSYIVNKVSEREVCYNRSKIIIPAETINIRELKKKIMALISE